MCPTLCDLMDCTMPGFPVLHYLLEFAQTHVYWVGDTIEPSHLLLPPSSPAFNPSQHKGLFQWVGSLHQVAKVLGSSSPSVPPKNQFSSVTQSCPVLCIPMDCSMPGFPVHHQLPELCSNSCPPSRWCYPTISSSVIPFSFCLQSFPGSGSFLRSQFFMSGDQSIGVSASTSVLPMNIQDWFPLGLTGWISLQSKGLSKSLLQHHSSKASILRCSTFFIVQLAHPYMTTGKTRALTRRTFVGKVMSLLFLLLGLR